jgi:uncharacterized protein YbjT (DUF2867 family)
MKILVFGGTGQVGSRVVKGLVERKADVRLFLRKSGVTPPTDVEVALGDLMDPVSVEKALEGIHKVYLLNAAVPEELVHGLNVCELARRAKVKHLVYHSVFDAERFKGVPFFATKVAIENAIHHSGVPFTFLRPNYFMQNDTALKEPLMKAGIYPAPIGDLGVGMIDARDIAEATVIALTTEGHVGKTYNLNGSEILGGAGVAAIWNQALGREVRYVGDDLQQFEAGVRQQVPAWKALAFRVMFQVFQEEGYGGEESDVETLSKLLGGPPRRYEDFARETAQAWKEEERRAA